MAPSTRVRSIAKMGRIWNTNIAFSSDCHRHCSLSSCLPPTQCPSRKNISTRTVSRIRAINVSNHHYQTIRLLPLSSRRCFASEITSDSTHDTKKTKKPILTAKDFKYCVDLVQNRDRESYLCGLLMPHDARKSYFAIRAWNVELASIKDGSTLKKSGGGTDSGGPNVALQVRYQWWWDALNQIYDNPQQEQNNKSSINENDYAPFSVSNTLAASYLKNPIVRVLNYAVYEKQLTRRFIERLSEARETDLRSQQRETMTEMIEYADNIFSSLLYLTLETVDVRDESVDIVAQHAGIGIGLVTALRGIRMRLIRGECSIPKELLPPNFSYDKLIYTNNSSFADDEDQDNPIDEAQEKENNLNDEERQLLRDAVEQICILGYSHLSQAQELQSDVPKHARTCFLPLIPAMHYLTKLKKADYDIFDEKLLEHDNMTILALLGRTWLTGVF
jgi:NADH dehydrogenase [ubiquinone] 1 alpha subcomplex assembly factor 6